MADESRIELGGGYSLQIKPDLSGTVTNAKGKKLASVPPKVKKMEAWLRWQDLRKSHQRRLKDNEAIIVGWMVSGERVSGEVLRTMWQDPAWRAKLKGLLLLGDGHKTSGMLMDATEKGLGLVTQELDSKWVKGKWWRVPHLAGFSDDDLEAWRACSVESGIVQGVAQLARPLYLPSAGEQASRTSARFADRTLDNAARISHAFNRRGWSTSNGVASCAYAVLRGGEDPLKVSVRFEYFAGW
ncbi:MAG: DUF4132 domain-containing protein [Deltaproteobacteria bacterium]|nr:DUF4132 domain-containing protein [Deltaproteobacteria bacterium]